MVAPKLERAWSLLKETVQEWTDDDVPRLAAALAYYTVFSLAPLLIIVISAAGLFFGQEAVEGRIVGQISGLVGERGAEAVQAMVANAARPGAGLIATVIGLCTLFIGATGVFAELQEAMDTIWDVKPRPGQGIWGTVKRRVLSFTMVLGTGFLLLVSLVLSAAVAGLAGYLETRMPGISILSRLLTHALGLALTSAVFALIFKMVPDIEIGWRDVWLGAVLTALLFSIGRFALGEYLGRGAFASSYGAAGSLVVILFWVYYSAQIVLFGAEFTQVYARSRGSEIRPSANAVPADEPAPSLRTPAEQH